MAVDLVLLDLDETLVPTEFLRDARHGHEPLLLADLPGFQELVVHEGVADALCLLETRFPIGLVTSSPRWYVDQLLAACLPGFAFCVTVTYDDVERIKPDPEPILRALDQTSTRQSAAVYVGDDLVDHQAAVNAGVAFLGAGWAAHPTFPAHALQAQSPSGLLRSIEELVL